MATKTTTKRCTLCKSRPVIGGVRGSVESVYCQPCMSYAEDENMHSDESHDHYYAADASDEIKAEAAKLVADGMMSIRDNCLVCSSVDPATVEYVAPKGHSNGGVKPGTKMTSHAGCNHAATKSARAACRKQRAAGE
jgi:hypothetical protein